MFPSPAPGGAQGLPPRTAGPSTGQAISSHTVRAQPSLGGLCRAPRGNRSPQPQEMSSFSPSSLSPGLRLSHLTPILGGTVGTESQAAAQNPFNSLGLVRSPRRPSPGLRAWGHLFHRAGASGDQQRPAHAGMHAPAGRQTLCTHCGSRRAALTLSPGPGGPACRFLRALEELMPSPSPPSPWA